MVFSVRYDTRDNNIECAVDWDWEIKKQWARSEKEGARWYPIRGLDQESYLAIIQKFGLENEKNLSIEEVVNISPEKLGEIRRKKEKLERLAHKEIISDTLGEHVEIR
ncbi:Uncharacterised protein [uncultured archaeon]|nr:Uncharacterised protein [uncultured archaeon]